MSPNRFRAWYASGAGRPLVLAHRGDSSRAPENTLEAARLGLEAGADGWEFDVRLTRDGVPVLVHDESLLRTTDAARRFEGDPRAASGFLVSEMDLGEVRSLDAGSWFLDPAGGPRSAAGFGSAGRLAEADRAAYASGRVRIPTLAEALGWTAGRGWLANVEVKESAGPRGPLVESVLGAIRDSGALGLVTVSSFDLEVVARVASAEPGVATGALVEGSVVGDVEAWLRRVGADALHAPAGAILEAACPLRTSPVLAYTVNDAGPSGQAARLAEAGVAGLFTDDPASVCRLWKINRS